MALHYFLSHLQPLFSAAEALFLFFFFWFLRRRAMGHHSLTSPISGPQPRLMSPLSIFLLPSTWVQGVLAWAQGHALFSKTPPLLPDDSDVGVP